MNRAQRRAVEKQHHTTLRKPPTYNVTRPMLHTMVQEEIGRDLQQIKQEAMDEAINTAMILMLTLPLEVLMDHFIEPDDIRKVIPDFTNLVLEYYSAWQNDELDMDKLKEDLWEYGGIRLEEGNESNNWGQPLEGEKDGQSEEES